MALYPYALFFHIVGVLGLFIAISLEMIAALRLHAAQTTAQVREWMAVTRALEIILPASALLLLASGLFMLFNVWGWSQAWIDLSLGTLIILGIAGSVINGPRMKAIQKAVEMASAGEISAALRKRISDPVLRAYAPIPVLMAVGAVGLMTLKLDWVGSGVVMVVALIAGIIGGAAITRSSSHSARHSSQIELRS